MRPLWLEHSEEFYLKLFAYLKKKFPYKIKAFQLIGQNTTDVSIYHETIVALEQVHEVLRKIENRSAPTRDDYETALKNNNAEQAQSIIDFYQKLIGVAAPELCDAYKIFNRNYYWDSLLAHYVSFVDEDFALYEKFLSSWNSKKNTLDIDSFFSFIEVYQVALDLKEGGISSSLEQVIQYQNDAYNRLVADYDELACRGEQVGISIFDIILPKGIFFKVVRDLESAFKYDDSVLMQVSHVHRAQKNKYMISYLVLYKTSLHETSQQFIKWCESILLKRWGEHIFDRYMRIFDQEGLIKAVFPNNVFVGKLTAKQQITFRNTFLKYFFSSIFLFRMDQDSKDENEEKEKGLVLNTHQFWKEKIYIDDVKQKRDNSTKKAVSNTISEYLSDLLDDSDIDKIDKYFSRKNLADQGHDRLKLLEYLYSQQSILSIKPNLLEDLMRIETFLTRLNYDSVFEYSATSSADKFQKSPRMSKLSPLLQQFSLVSQISCLIRRNDFFIEPRTQAVRFIHQFSNFFNEDYLLSNLYKLRQDLKEYRRDELKPNLKEESASLKKVESTKASIQNYLEQILKKDVIVMRFIFNCNRVRDGALFDEMFRDYIENLKRRNTAGTRLIGHIGVYIPYEKDHYIDATLLFEFNEHKEIESEQLKEEVIKYWEKYASIKKDQIKAFNKRHGQSNEDIHNPFGEYKDRALTAISVAIVKTENLLNDIYIEIRQGQNKVIKLLVQCLAEFYAYCPMVLMSQDDLKYLPRKNYLILGRIRTKNTKKREKVLKHIESPSTIESPEGNLVLCSADNKKQNDVIESDNCDLSNAQHIPSEISESANQISQKQADFQDAPEESLESNQENEFTQINTPELLSDKNHTVLIKDNKQIRARAKVIQVTTKKKHTVLIKENKQIGVQARAQVIHVLTKKKHIFVKPNPDQLASEERAKEKNKDT